MSAKSGRPKSQRKPAPVHVAGRASIGALERTRAVDHAGLVPVTPLDLSRVRNVSDLVAEMEHCSFGARKVGEATDLLCRMALDPDCYVVLTISGAMTVAKMGLVVADMIEWGMVHAVVATGALMTHGLVEGQGLTHFKTPENATDEDLFCRGYNRVYDTLEAEANLDETQRLFSAALERHRDGTPLSSADMCRLLGEELVRREVPGRAILKSAVARGVPVYVPALTDSELGLDFLVNNKARARRKQPGFSYDAFKDVEDFAARIKAQKVTGIFTIGGGVPRNWAQQVSPYLDLLAARLDDRDEFYPYKYGVRICPDPVHFGHLSGCTYSEGVSWGKLVPPSQGGAWVEVFSDATIAWPLIVQAAAERLRAAGKLPLKKKLPSPV